MAITTSILGNLPQGQDLPQHAEELVKVPSQQLTSPMLVIRSEPKVGHLDFLYPDHATPAGPRSRAGGQRR